MTDNPTAPAAVPDPAYLRALVAERLGRDPIEYAIELRASTQPAMAWNRIAQIIQNATGLYLTQEAVRRWVRKHERALEQNDEVGDPARQHAA